MRITFAKVFWIFFFCAVFGALLAMITQQVRLSGREYQLRCVIGQSPSMTSEWGLTTPYLDKGAAWSLPGGGFYRMKEGEACKPVYRKAGG
jgi:hypothetical protein